MHTSIRHTEPERRTRKTILPQELRSLKSQISCGMNKHLEATPEKDTGDVIPNSHDDELLSTTSSVVLARRSRSEKRSDVLSSDDQLISDDDSDCGMINGRAFRNSRDSVDLTQHGSSEHSADMDCSSSDSLLLLNVRKSLQFSKETDKKSVAMDFTDISNDLSKENGKGVLARESVAGREPLANITGEQINSF